MSNRFYTVPVVLFLVLLLAVLPVSAYKVAIYGTNAGLDPDLHKDSMEVVKSIPGSSGGDLDGNIDKFTQSSVDIIILGGDDTFTPSSAAKIEEAVARGAILVVGFPSNHPLDASLPATNGGTSAAGPGLDLSNAGSAESKEVFSGFATPFELVGTAPEKENAVLRNGAVALLNHNDGMPALAYIKYGGGYVIEWTTKPVPAYMDAETADAIVYRLITRLSPAKMSTATAVTTVPTTTPVATTAVTTAVTTAATSTPQETNASVQTTQSPSASSTIGDVSVYSSPVGASILIDGKYYGTTPASLNNVPQGNHIIRLTMSGYYDYEGTVYIVPGQENHAFGTLQPVNQVTSAATAVPIIIPVVTVAPTQTTESGNIWNNSSIIVAIIGVLTAVIAAAASIFTHVNPPAKKE